MNGELLFKLSVFGLNSTKCFFKETLCHDIEEGVGEA